jgi:hypothetical protein
MQQRFLGTLLVCLVDHVELREGVLVALSRCSHLVPIETLYSTSELLLSVWKELMESSTLELQFHTDRILSRSICTFTEPIVNEVQLCTLDQTNALLVSISGMEVRKNCIFEQLHMAESTFLHFRTNCNTRFGIIVGHLNLFELRMVHRGMGNICLKSNCYQKVCFK